MFAEYLADNGCAVVCFDYRGFGDSLKGPLRHCRASMEQWGSHDLAAMIDWMGGRHRCDLVCVDHSVGGQAFGLAANNSRVRSLLAVAAQSGYWGHWDWPRRYLVWMLWHLAVPSLTPCWVPFRATGSAASALPPEQAQQWVRWRRSPHCVSHPGGRPRREHFHAYLGHAHLVAVADDQLFVTPRVAAALTGFYRGADIRMTTASLSEHGLDRLGHFDVFRERGRTLWPGFLDWLRARRLAA